VSKTKETRDEVMRKLVRMADGGPNSCPEAVYNEARALGEDHDYALFLAREQKRLFNSEVTNA
jgi:hypothetical protein